ncbi:hypothetical protein EKK58_11340 [Candidatus Dependentiae bacterium]|nr:MAG: hypothetical protein EKK58_11340 [Candidatus Dependentiae bacterium]
MKIYKINTQALCYEHNLLFISCENEAGKVFNLVLPTSNLVKPNNLPAKHLIDISETVNSIPDILAFNVTVSGQVQWYEFKGSYTIYSDSLNIMPHALNENGVLIAKTTIALGVKGKSFKQEQQEFQKGLLFDETTTFDLAKPVVEFLLS